MSSTRHGTVAAPGRSGAGDSYSINEPRNEAAGLAPLSDKQPGVSDTSASLAARGSGNDKGDNTRTDTEPAEPTTSVQDTITGPTSADVVPSARLSAQNTGA